MQRPDEVEYFNNKISGHTKQLYKKRDLTRIYSQDVN